MDIRCRKRQCMYNDKFTCKAKEILIDGNVICSKYEKDTNKKVDDTTRSLFDKTPEYAPQRDSKTMEINCKATCLFNHNGKCVSNGITLNAINEKPYCISFLNNNAKK